jgi:hypothetical protein
MRTFTKRWRAEARTRLVHLFGVVAVVLVVVIYGTALAQSSNTTLGNWKLNLAKSKYDPGPPPMSETRVYEAWETDGVKATYTRVQADGTRITLAWAAHYDGKDYKYTGSPDFDTIALKRVDANTTDATLKKGGKVVQTTKGVVSSDGKTRTTTTTGTNPKGQRINNVAVFDRQ